MKCLRLMVLLFLGLAIPVSMAANLPENYPQGFTHIGMIGAIDSNRRALVMGDVTYSMADVVLVHEVNGRSHELSSRDIGKEAGIRTSSFSRGIVREVWVLPRGSLPAR